VDSEIGHRKEQIRVLRDRERLRFRVFAAVRDVALGTELFRTHAEIHEPEVTVNVLGHVVDVTTALTERQLHVLREKVRAEDLRRFADELRAGIEAGAAKLNLEFSTDPARHGGSQPVLLAGVPSGYRAVLVRRDAE
jgi:hypothetical protein